MNIERLKVVREYIASHRDRFKYHCVLEANGEELYRNIHCATLGCVAGWTLFLFYPDFDGSKAYGTRMSCAADLLELSSSEKWWLFVPWTIANELEINDVDEAIRRLDWLIEHETIEGYISPSIPSIPVE